MAARIRKLAIAVATGRIGYVLFRGDELVDWGLSRVAARSPERARAQTLTWIERLKPDVVITEKLHKHSRKGEKTRSLIEAVAKVANEAFLLDVQVTRTRTHENKYEEAAALAEQFPLLKPWLPKRPRIWESEPREMIIFEAAALSRN